MTEVTNKRELGLQLECQNKLMNIFYEPCIVLGSRVYRIEYGTVPWSLSSWEEKI